MYWKCFRATVMLAAILVSCGLVHGSSAGFTLTAEGADLGKPDESGEIPRYRVKAQVGKPLTLVAQGLVMPRGAAPQPGEPDAAAWLFDDAAFGLRAQEKKGADATKSAIVLSPLKVGEYRVRFVGLILGYEKKLDVVVEVAGQEK